ncbi:zinc-binding dehydrogenase [Thermoleophilia bacterium SCSIO 60948]|nr:zinc-binding dehydrogenase [Thermoleophilia bacterium SCSIO 60948]
MIAVRLTGHGGLDKLEVADVPDPTPGPGEVLIEVGAAALNNTDIWTREGSYGSPGPASGWRGPIAFPRIQGGDVAGRIAELGPGVDAELEVGDRVLVDPAYYDGDRPDNPGELVGVLGSEHDGGFAELVVVPSGQVHEMRDSPLNDAELACLPIAYGTATGMLERGGVGAGETVLVTGASGGVGLALVSLGAARGARVVAVTTSANADVVLAAGAAETIDRESESIEERARAFAPGGLDAIADVVAGPESPRLLDLLRDGGRWVVAGAIAGPRVEIDLRRLYLPSRRMIGSTMHTPRHFERLADDARSGKIRPHIASVRPLEELADAEEELARRAHTGKLVVVPSRATGS